MRLLFGLLLFVTNVSGQDILSPKDSSVIEIIEELPSHEPFDTSRSYQRVEQQYVYIISNNDLYRIFGYETSANYREFNFADHHILGRQINSYWNWQKRENKKAFVEIPSTTQFGYVGTKVANEPTVFFEDTLMRSPNDSAQWYTQGHGDCFARFEYAVVRDKHHPVVLLIERNYWGGCRAGGSKAYTISFTRPQNIVQYSKNTILMDKYRNQPEN